MPWIVVGHRLAPDENDLLALMTHSTARSAENTHFAARRAGRRRQPARG
jgi:hypothetical protein